MYMCICVYMEHWPIEFAAWLTTIEESMGYELGDIQINNKVRGKQLV